MNKRLFCIHVMVLTFAMVSMAQSLGVRTSGTMWLTATPNIEVNYVVGKKISLHLPVLYNPFTFNDNSRLQQLTVMPGARYWTVAPHAKWFFSAFGIASRFHMGGWFDHKYRYDGKCFGGGIGGGYSWILGKRINLEMELGIGAGYADYDKCGWKSNSRNYGNERGFRIFPAKFDVSFNYLF